MMDMVREKGSRCKEFVSIALLLILNIFIRYPITPHELGVDSFVTHKLANSILEYGYAKWIIHPLSFFGLYPYSYSSGLHYILAIFSLITGLQMEFAIYVFSLMIAILGMFSAYTLAGEFNNTPSFRYLVAFIFSISPLALKFTIWTVSARGIFYMLVPLFLWCLMRINKKRDVRYIFLVILFLIFLASAHKMFVILLLFIIAYFFGYATLFLTRNLGFIRRNPRLLSLIMSLMILFLFLIQYPIYGSGSYWVMRYLFLGYRTYMLIISLLYVMFARLGLILLLSLAGLTVVIWQRGNTFKEFFLIYSFLFFTPFLSHSMYFYESLLPIFSLLSGFGIIYLTGFLRRFIRENHATFLILVIMICFSLFTLFVRLVNIDPSGYHNYMHESTYQLTKFFRIETDDSLLFGEQDRIISAFVDNPVIPIIIKPFTPLLTPDYIIHDFVEENSLQIKRKQFPDSVNTLFTFVKYPYDVNQPTIVYEPEYIVERSWASNFWGNRRVNRVYDNGYETIFYLS